MLLSIRIDRNPDWRGQPVWNAQTRGVATSDTTIAKAVERLLRHLEERGELE